MNEDNKDYIINLRVSRETYEKIKEKASENRETISHLLRKVIDDSSEIISDVSQEILGKKSSFDDIVSYHKSILAKETPCSKCKKTIPKNKTITIGETKSNKRYIFCSACK